MMHSKLEKCFKRLKSFHIEDQYWQLSWYWPVAVQWLAGLCQCQCSSVSPLYWQCVWAGAGSVYTEVHHLQLLTPKHQEKIYPVFTFKTKKFFLYYQVYRKYDNIQKKKQMSVLVRLLLFVERITFFTWMDSF